MRKKTEVKVKPIQPPHQASQLIVLGRQFGEVIRQYNIIKASMVNLEKELIRLGKIIHQLQRQAELKKVEARIEKGERK